MNALRALNDNDLAAFIAMLAVLAIVAFLLALFAV